MKGPRQVELICLCLLKLTLARRTGESGGASVYFDGVCTVCGRKATLAIQKEPKP